MKLFKFLNAGFLNLLFPLHCAGCGEKLSPRKAGFPLCKNCFPQLHFYSTEIKSDTYAVCRYEGIVKKIVHNLKYKKKRFLAVIPGTILADFYKKNFNSRNIDFIVPVPLHRVRKRERGFNQAELIAERMKKILNLPWSSNLLRIRNTPSQTLISKAERLRNLKGAFRARRPFSFYGKNILLIDDVYTTGATTEECKKILKEAKAKKVFVLTFAK
ncbi:MAG: ComF family protein [bacterium (Candidatus Ratteibacteria) CG_4_10_14_3_um_filter_41_18]|uniref:ComF family protein n=4 Tax=Candidatus Ratteibacteria TaxID=2979319 RepID=A0A2M7YED6_9BACT|nr:MAG: hypothetical protein AUJ76_00535 [Candidatus Omnitrophica bacterium CG1_02_41_171]PIV64826.1 MAG: ComF family protein [bacterium (Candidatus Ratteibacteria) CG01_land_8_20_14_3_00_40_19]PIW34249.1 MAG: ComF family protein [bacterium (Candidatus Ratteibacteria) CG15_BIG_FIL_POST_REV_8_21_14_020_41_12]PIX77652.1 MAG: ComF family protein [bacterium (Candidatus Ratteibacteria) CG_4_10_14_3_um_filter_41_18]PJA61350.1 MAG: ComF family protein [bacterium (Candidatus Ratteibacteria) CG_4_9_14_3